jgi:hypothetical protein
MNNRRDILVLEENTIGEDYIIADLHGNAACLEGALAELKQGDRLFIAGDLTDRGEKSIGVIKLILNYQARHPDTLYVVKGNHEVNNLECIQALADFFEDLEKIPYSADDDSHLKSYASYFTSKETNTLGVQQQDIQFCLIGGGYWLLQLFRHEMMTKDLFLTKVQSLGASDKSAISKYFNFVSEFPYIIYVKGKRPFTVVHAHMPFTHVTMKEMLAQGITELSEIEKFNAANMRTSEFKEFLEQFDCDDFTMPTYAGHTIINGINSFPLHYASKTVVADVMAYQSGILLLINHTKFSCQYVGPNVFAIPLMEADYGKILEQVRSHLDMEKNKYLGMGDENDESASPQRKSKKRERSAEVKLLDCATLYNSSYTKKGKSEQCQQEVSDNTQDNLSPKGIY